MMAGSLGRKALVAALGLGTTVAGGVIYSLENSVKADIFHLHPPALKWTHHGFLQAFDHASIRRGYQVYKQVCAACHSLELMHYRKLVNITHTEDEAKAEAAEVMVVDGPDETGAMFERPGKLSDPFPRPYPNNEAAAAANNGAVPPDLSLVVLGRRGNEDYVYHLLTSYCDPPAGLTLDEGQHFNPYFLGGAIGMQPPLYNEIIEYDDGTPATQSQLAKDVVTFLTWTGSPEHDTRKRYFLKSMVFIVLGTAISYYMMRFRWSVLKTQKYFFKPKKYDY